MRVKKFVARTLPEAMAQVKADLGPEAVILHTQSVKVGGFMGLFGQRMIEVMAAGEVAERKLMPASVAATAQLLAAHPAGAGALPGDRRGGPPSPAASLQSAREYQHLRGELERVESMVGQVLERLAVPPQLQDLPPELQQAYGTLTGRGVEPDLAADLVRRAAAEAVGDRTPAGVLQELLEADLGDPAVIDASSGQRRVVALIGPTGVGKTTTLAKLAAFFALGRRTRLAVLTADTYRIAAVEQLRTYCDIIGVPLAVVQTPGETAAALRAHDGFDLVLVDTAGRSHQNAAQMAELQAYLRALQPDETYLVLSLTASVRDAAAAAEAFGAIGYDRLLLTKLDETTAAGMTYNLARRCRRPLSYLTFGQNVPDDIEVAQSARISRLLLGDPS